MRTIAIVNQKGGCGKTTTAINLAAVYASQGKRTLVVDMDPQSHCAAGLGVPEESLNNHIGKALLANLSKGFDRTNLIWEVSRNLDLAPSAMSLAGLEAPGGGLHQLEDKDRRLTKLLMHLAPHYEMCFIDCPPAIGLLTYNALRASGEAIIPVQTEFFALRGAKKQYDTIRHLADRIKHPIGCYVLPTLFNKDEKIAQDILSAIRKQFGGKVIPIVVSERQEIREAASFGQPVAEYAPDSEAVRDFQKLAAWLEDHPADPPEIQVEITRSIIVPYHLNNEFQQQSDEGDNAVSGEERRQTVSIAPPDIIQPPILPHDGSRAAEMARKVQELTRQRESKKTAEQDDQTFSTTEVEAPASPSTTIKTATVSDDLAKLTSTSSVRSAADAAFLAAQRRATLIEPKDMPPSIEVERTKFVRLYGVRQLAQGVMFIQPGHPGMSIHIAGDFNSWSASASPMRYNRDVGVFELLLPLHNQGRYEYRLVVDGQWQTDPYNSRRRRNEFGADNNYFDLK